MDPASERDVLTAALRLVEQEAERLLSELDSARVRPPRVPDAGPVPPLPADGVGSLASLRELVEAALEGATRSAGPRFFHFVMGGGTPAALGADWLTSTLDQNAYNWISSPFGMRMEQIATAWLLDLFGIPRGWSAVLTTGATMANFVALASARRWWSLQHGVDIEADGWGGLPPVPVLAGGYLHVSAMKALAMLGIGRTRAKILQRDAAGRLDLAALEAELRALRGAPAIVSLTAGDINTGDFDPLDEAGDLARAHNAWLHVDGAFGLFAAVTPATRERLAGLEHADSVAGDGHKWLNLPYDTGFAFVRHGDVHTGAFAPSAAAYLGTEALSRPVFGNLGPELSRRARALTVWATLRAYGKDGIRAMVERHLELARRVAAQVDEAPDLERLSDVPLNVVCFRFHPPGVDDSELDELNRRLGELILEDGRVYFGTTQFAGMVAFRPAFVNWRTREEDVDMVVQVTRELGARLIAERASP